MTLLTLVIASFLGTSLAAEPDWPDLSEPPRRASASGARDAAVVIGIEDYDRAQPIPGARGNAIAWSRWLERAHRVPTVHTLLDGDATREEIERATLKAASEVKDGGRLWIVYIGHGAPSADGNDGLLVGVDARQTALSLETRSVRRSELLDRVEKKLPADSEVLLLQDACFSGKTPAGDLAPGLAPLQVVDVSIGPRITVLSAARNDQYAGPLPDSSRPAFSYLALGGVRGWADLDGDGVVTSGELLRYTSDALLQTVTGRQQNPELSGSDTLAVARSAGESPPDMLTLAVARSDGRGSRRVEVRIGPDRLSLAEVQSQIARIRADREQSSGDRAARIAALTRDLRARALRDLAHIEGLLDTPTAQDRVPLEVWLDLYGQPVVEVDAQEVRIHLEEALPVFDALSRVPDPTLTHWTGANGYAMRKVDPGTYALTSTPASTHSYEVTLTRGYWLGTHEVTVELWEEVMGPSPSMGGPCGPTCPVQRVSWSEALRFANALSEREGLQACYVLTEFPPRWRRTKTCTGYRLPTTVEAMLVRTAPGAHPETAAGSGGVMPVGQQPPSPWGFFDLEGNVAEWAWDYPYRLSKRQTDPIGRQSGPNATQDPKRGIVGSSYLDREPGNLLATTFGWHDHRYDHVGFRLARTIP